MNDFRSMICSSSCRARGHLYLSLVWKGGRGSENVSKDPYFTSLDSSLLLWIFSLSCFWSTNLTFGRKNPLEAGSLQYTDFSKPPPSFSPNSLPATSDDPYQEQHISTAYPSQISSSTSSPSSNSTISASSIFTRYSISSTLTKFSPNQSSPITLISGLPTSYVQTARIKAGGPNEFKVKASDSPLQKFIQQFKEPLILLLLGSATVSLLIGEKDDAISIALAVVVVITGE